MEKYYIVANDCKIGIDYLNYKADSDLLYMTYLEFAKEKGISSKSVYCTINRLWIEPTNDDKINFQSSFMKNEKGKFKKSSKLSKEWVNLCKSKGIKGLSKPMLALYFLLDVFSECHSRLFELDGVIYSIFESESEFTAPEGFTEIKASSFYKIMEEHNIKL